MERSRGYINRFRTDGFQAHELKVYWNAEQPEILCPSNGEHQDALMCPHDPLDNEPSRPFASFQSQNEIMLERSLMSITEFKKRSLTCRRMLKSLF
jgi:hypothetical protein